MKAYKKTMIITVLITLFPILIGLALWNKLPDQLPTHWDAGSQVDGSYMVMSLKGDMSVLEVKGA